MSKGEAKLYIGTSGWSYPHWQAIFYPEDLAKRKWLEFYTEHFDTVELNNPFYHLPRESTFEGWYKRTPKNFVFSVKVSRFISHVKYLKNCKEPWQNFYQRAKLLKEKLGPFLIQLPANWKKDLDRLKDFTKILKKISAKERFAFEFRHKSWFDKEIYNFFKKQKGISLCLADSSRWPRTIASGEARGKPRTFEITDDFVYLRFHGPGQLYGSKYSKKDLETWAAKIKEYLKQGRDVFCYFNNDFQAYAVQNAKELKQILIF